MRADELVEVQAVKGHQDDRAATGWRYAGETYLTTFGLARRRERAGLVEIQGDAPAEVPEEETVASEDVQDAESAEAEEIEDEDQTEGKDAPEEREDGEEAADE